MNRDRPVIVYGPAYRDRVLRVDGPLLDPRWGGPLDRGMEGLRQANAPESNDTILELRDERGGTLRIDPPRGWPGPVGRIQLAGSLAPEQTASPWERALRGVDWLDDLGGMGAGYAKALGGLLISAVGGARDDVASRVESLLMREAIAHRAVHVAGEVSDWTLLVSSGPFGDKLPIGFRGCHSSAPSFLSVGPEPGALQNEKEECGRIVVAAGLPNRHVAEILSAWSRPGVLRVFAPAMRNMTDRNPPIVSFAALCDVITCNTQEWAALSDSDRLHLAELRALVAVTDGPRGGTVHFHDTDEGPKRAFSFPAFPRDSPPKDTNRAGEAFAATLVTALLDSGWRAAEPIDEVCLRRAVTRAAAAAALVLDFETFRFPTASDVTRAVNAGRVAASD